MRSANQKDEDSPSGENNGRDEPSMTTRRESQRSEIQISTEFSIQSSTQQNENTYEVLKSTELTTTTTTTIEKTTSQGDAVAATARSNSSSSASTSGGSGQNKAAIDGNKEEKEIEVHKMEAQTARAAENDVHSTTTPSEVAAQMSNEDQQQKAQARAARNVAASTDLAASSAAASTTIAASTEETVQIIDAGRVLPVISSNAEQAQTNDKTSYCANDTRSNDNRVGAFASQPSSSAATGGIGSDSAPTPSREQDAENSAVADEQSAPMIVHATLVVEAADEELPGRNDTSQDAPTTGRRGNLGSPHDAARRRNNATEQANETTQPPQDSHRHQDLEPQLGPNVVVENVVMDESVAGMTSERALRPLEMVVQATPLREEEDKRFFQGRKGQVILGLVVVLVLVIVLAVTLDDAGLNINTPPPPNPGLPNDDDDDQVGEENGLDLGNTTKGFINHVLPAFTRAALADTDSPQSQALEWLWQDPIQTSQLPNFRRVQRFALATMFYAAANPADQENVGRTNWLTDDHECTWWTNDSPSIMCPDGERWRTIELSAFLLEGYIPPEVGLLTDLVSIDVSDNPALTGPIPSQIGLLTNLDQLLIDNSAITGALPSEMGMLTNLRFLTLSNNHLVSTIPTEFGSLTNMHYLEVSINQLTGPIPMELFENKRLQTLLFHFNGLSGTIATQIGQLTNLHIFVVSQNAMVGTIPTEFGNLPSMEILMLDGNQFTGTVPEQLGNLLALDTLTLFESDLTGTLPSNICDLVESADLDQLLVNCSQVTCNCTDCSFCSDLS